MPLETPDQAARFNRRLVTACVLAQSQPTPASGPASSRHHRGRRHRHRIGCRAASYRTRLDKINPDRNLRIVLIAAAIASARAA